VESAALGPLTIIAQPFRLSRPPSRLVSAAAECGTHTDDILAELEHSADEIADLRKRQII